MANLPTVPPSSDNTMNPPAGPVHVDAGSRDRDRYPGRPGPVPAAADGTPRSWSLVLPAPAPWLSANDRVGWATRARAARSWRNAAYLALCQARPAKGLARLRLDLVLFFADRRSRDTDNFRATVKPVVDAFGPPFVRLPRGDSRGAAAPGFGVVPDDDPAHLDGPHLHLGGCTWAEYARRATPADLTGYPRGGRLTVSHPIAHLVANRRGGLLVVATDLSELPAGRTWTPALAAPAGGERVRVKRACNGCGCLLGDVTAVEVAAALLAEELPDVRGECPTCRPVQP